MIWLWSLCSAQVYLALVLGSPLSHLFSLVTLRADNQTVSAHRFWTYKNANSYSTNRIEVLVKQILSGVTFKTNASVANPEALDWFREWAKKQPKDKLAQLGVENVDAAMFDRSGVRVARGGERERSHCRL